MQPAEQRLAESFVNTCKRDCAAGMDLSDAQTVMAQLPGAFEHFNEVHPVIVDNALAAGVRAAAGSTGAPGTIDEPGALLRLTRGREYGGQYHPEIVLQNADVVA